MIEKLDGLQQVAARYQAYILDQWGVIHNGVRVLDGALEAIHQIRQQKGRIVLLSNSGKRSVVSKGRLEKLGITPDLYDLCMTSGEDVHRCLVDRDEEFYQSLGPKFLMFAWDNERELFSGTSFQEVTEVAQADFLVAAGLDQPEVAAYEPVLQQAIDRKLPMICVNPDLVSVEPDGRLKPCPGAIAKLYEEMGGQVRWHGKPDPGLYAHILSYLQDHHGIARQDILAIGDSLSHDIKGAAQAGIDSLLITSGIHKDAIKGAEDQSGLAKLSQSYGVTPTYAMTRFCWSPLAVD